MSTNKGPFIPAGTAGRDTRAASALCLILCTQLGKGQKFSFFYILSGFSPFSLSPPSYAGGMVALLGVTGVSGVTATPTQPCLAFLVTILQS